MKIYHNNFPINLDPLVMSTLNLTDGQVVDEETAYRAMDLNAACMRADKQVNPNPLFKQMVEALETSIAAYYKQKG